MRQRNSTTEEVRVASEPKKVQSVPEIDRFAGPFGSLAMTFGLPLLVALLNWSCANFNGNLTETVQKALSLDPLVLFHQLFPSPTSFSIQIVFGWFVSQFVLSVIVPGYMYTGFEMKDGSRLPYKMNGLVCYLFTLWLFVAGVYFGYIPASVLDQVYQEWQSIYVTVLVYFAFGVSFLLYFKGFLFKQGDPCGNPIVDFFYGYEANPRLFGIAVTDFKFFFEGRALTLWVLIGFFFAEREIRTTGSLSVSMFLSCLVHFLYILHYNVHEENVLSMVDFTSEHQGFMLQYGNTAFLPFCYTLPEFYILKNPVNAPFWLIPLTLGLYAIGYTIFAQTNLQKKQFREDPTKPIWGKTPKVLHTSSGRKLLISGWWGIGRKMNYTGDLIQALTFGLPALSFHIIPLINFVFLTTLLIQRERRDFRYCKLRYGKDWDEYCEKVPAALIPYVY